MSRQRFQFSIGDFEFNLRELAGSMDDFDTLFPLAIGYFAVNGLNPAGLLVMMGLTNIVTGIIYHLPMPIEPKKVLAVVAITQRWPPSLIYATGFGTGHLANTWFHGSDSEDSGFDTEERGAWHPDSPGRDARHRGF